MISEGGGLRESTHPSDSPTPSEQKQEGWGEEEGGGVISEGGGLCESTHPSDSPTPSGQKQEGVR